MSKLLLILQWSVADRDRCPSHWDSDWILSPLCSRNCAYRTLRRFSLTRNLKTIIIKRICNQISLIVHITLQSQWQIQIFGHIMQRILAFGWAANIKWWIQTSG